MNRLYILIFSALFINSTSYSQNCLPEGIAFGIQEQIDNFQNDYPGCTVIDGYVAVIGDDIVNLEGLNILSGINGSFYLIDNILVSLEGMENLTFIGENFMVRDNVFLTDISAMSNLELIEGTLEIKSNNNLGDLSGLETLSHIGGNLVIYNNNSLVNITALNSLDSISGVINISYNEVLNMNFGLDNIASIGEDLIIIGNSSITSFLGLNNLNSIGGSIEIKENTNLTSLIGLESLTEIGGDLNIIFNENLENLIGLENIAASSIENLFIVGNYNLSSCEIQNICDYLAFPIGNIEINTNATGCNNEYEVEAACIVGIEETTPEQISIYPNPATNEVFITLENGQAVSEITIYNQLGKKMVQKEHVSRAIDISMLQPGFYFIEIVVGTSNTIKKIFIE